ncbi:MAG: hypothetical protein OXG04_07780, partial [Acidobacteria bacterium]|nr:hypothetical protein [Acidobacteriota bacterium]
MSSKVEAARPGQRGLVGRGQLRVALGVLVAVPGAGLGGVAHAVLHRADAVQQRLRLVDADVDPGVEHALAHDADPLGAVDDAEVLGYADVRSVLAQQPAAQAVEGGDPDALRVEGGQHRAQAAGHLVGGLAGEGDRGDALRRGAA